MVGWCDGRAVLNHHHRLNPRLRTWKPARLLSVGFTGHYAAMADRFGAAPIGCAAENVIIECDRIVSADELTAGLQVRSADGSTIDLEPAAVAKPCVPFTKYLLQNQDAEDELVAPNRAFLDHGMRGYVLGLANQGDVLGLATQGDVPGLANQGDVPGLANQGDVPGLATQGDVPGLANQGDVPGLANQGDVPGLANQGDAAIIRPGDQLWTSGLA